MTKAFDASEIHNGAICKSYCWSQSHSDIEIRIKLDRIIKYEQIEVRLTSTQLKVTILDSPFEHINADEEDSEGSEIGQVDLLELQNLKPKPLIEGAFERPVDKESAYWLLDNAEPSIVIYVDKAENMWWRKLLSNEKPEHTTPRDYTILMDHLDDGSRMAVDKLIVEQRMKMNNYRRRDHDLI